MQIEIKGEMTIPQLRQALWEELSVVEGDLAIRYSMGATLLLHPTNGTGGAVVPHDKFGAKIRKLFSNGPYRSAADEFKIK